MKTYEVLHYHTKPDPRVPWSRVFAQKFATVKETNKFLWFKEVKSYDIFNTASFWRYKDSGNFVSNELEDVMKSYRTYDDI